MNILKNYNYLLEGLDCANCAQKIEDKIASTEGYQEVSVNFSTLKLSFQTEKENPKKEIIPIIKAIEPDVKVLDMKDRRKGEERKKLSGHHKITSRNYDLLFSNLYTIRQ